MPIDPRRYKNNLFPHQRELLEKMSSMGSIPTPAESLGKTETELRFPEALPAGTLVTGLLVTPEEGSHPYHHFDEPVACIKDETSVFLGTTFRCRHGCEVCGVAEDGRLILSTVNPDYPVYNTDELIPVANLRALQDALTGNDPHKVWNILVQGTSAEVTK